MESENVEDNFISDDIKAQRSMKTAFLAILILVVALGFLAYFVVWNILLNKGDITFEGTAPFTIVSSTELLNVLKSA